MSEIQAPEPIERHEEIRVIEDEDFEHRERFVQDVAAERHGEISRLAAFVWFAFGVLEGLIALRFTLKLIAANPNSEFAQFIYVITEPFMLPFRGLTASPAANGIVVEIPALVAIIVYALLAWVIMKLIWLLLYRPSARTTSVYRRD
jgi:uncharacterized protein YggT (Ycf19 family)